MMKIYKITYSTYDYYIKNTKNTLERTITKEALSLKLSALIYHSTGEENIQDKKAYYFCNFSMLVDESTKTIISVRWFTRRHSRLCKYHYSNLKKTYLELGLDDSGSQIIKNQIA